MYLLCSTLRKNLTEIRRNFCKVEDNMQFIFHISQFSFYYLLHICLSSWLHANRLWRNQWSNLSSLFSNQVAGLTRKVHLKSETWQVLRQFEMNLVNGIWWGLKRFQQLSEGVACCMFVDSFFATHHSAASFTFSFCFCFSFAISLHETLHICFAERALCVCFFFFYYDATYPARMWRNMAGGVLRLSSSPFHFPSLALQFLILISLCCCCWCCCCRHLRNWRSCWHAITFVLPSRRSSSRIREWLRILHTIILCRNCWRNRVPEVSATKLNKKNNKQEPRNWKQAMKVKRKTGKKKKLYWKLNVNWTGQK